MQFNILTIYNAEEVGFSFLEHIEEDEFGNALSTSLLSVIDSKESFWICILQWHIIFQKY